MNVIKRYRNIALSNTDIENILDGKVNIVVYPELTDYDTIDELLGPYGSCIMLYETKPSYGHWCCINKINHNTVEFFDPYSSYPDDNLDHITTKFRKESNQFFPYLTLLLYNSGYNIDYNEFQFQKHANDIKSCGRWCCLRVMLKYLPLQEFAQIFMRPDGDDFVTFLTMWVNK